MYCTNKQQVTEVTSENCWIFLGLKKIAQQQQKTTTAAAETTEATQFGSSAPEVFSSNSTADPLRQNHHNTDMMIMAQVCRLCSEWKVYGDINALMDNMQQMRSSSGTRTVTWT